ncbi:MAG: hypothetical protein DI598_12640 [Pseudopedobacter saltans]|uniref:Uncharacterized protein n=1 Tax=Pseudopedobacter saltans TaxID=151895 RepID=A0A2W5ERS8_9SPHI|nr:MAG: hypothetical protein DI598_12640 [Pseudopedobacter saltans]
MIYRKGRKRVSPRGQRLKIMIEDIPQVWQATFLIPIVFNNLQAWVQFVSYSKGNGSFYLIATYLMLNTIGSFVLILFTQENKKIHSYSRKQYPEAFIN